MESCDEGWSQVMRTEDISKRPPFMIPDTKPVNELSDGLRKETHDSE